MGYCFRRQDFPWAVIWEENCSREVNPWRERTETRGMEFGSTPLPCTRREAFATAPLFATPMFSIVSARGSLTADYVTFLANVPPDFGEVRDVTLEKDTILVQGSAQKLPLRVPARGVAGRLGH